MFTHDELFKNENIKHTLVDFANVKPTYDMIDKSLLIEASDPNLSDEEACERILKTLREFRMTNVYCYKFTSTCPICFEEYDLKDLHDLCNCGHKCCMKCWEDVCHEQIHRSFRRLHCFECDRVIPQDIVNKHEFVPEEIQYSYYLGVYNYENHDLIECPKCKSQFIFTNPEHTCCPKCFYEICPKCNLLAHHYLNKTCREFESFMKTDEYIHYSQKLLATQLKRQREREWELIKEQSKKDYRQMLFMELKQGVIMREERVKEKERQKRLLEQNAENEKWLRSNTKQCPNCHAPIEKNKGCNHMTCIYCKHEFCWICGAKYFDGHFNRFSKCKQFDDGYRE